MRPPRLWLSRVFGGGGAPGSLTGTVTGPHLEPERCQSLAERLGLADTGFVDLGHPEPPRLLSFSPGEELAFCTQTLLAAGAVAALCRRRTGPVRLWTRAGEALVSPGRGGQWWVEASPQAAGQAHGTARLLGGLGISPRELAGEPAVAGIARRRLYLPLGSFEDLQAARPTSAQVRRACAENGLTAICLFTVLSPERVALRVFTTSLGGAEDAATGGAALGLLACDRRHPLGLADSLCVEQGQVDTVQRGCLLLRRTAGGEAVGGLVQVLSRGSVIDAVD